MLSSKILAKIVEKAITNPKKFAIMLLTINLLALIALYVVNTNAQEVTPAGEKGLGLIAAGLAIGGACFGAGIAVYGAASAGLAAIVERPGVAVWVLILAGLGEGIAVWGFVIAILILGTL